jgi:hypothetical protein
MSRKAKAKRFNEGKVGIHLLPPDVLLEVAKVYDFGAKKYGDHNWCNGLAWDKGTRASLERHLLKWAAGEEVDEESGLPHDLHVAWNALTMVAHRIREIGVDDRFKVVKPKTKKKR